MGKLSNAETARVGELAAELDVVRIGAASAIPTVMHELRSLAGLETLLCYCPVERTTGWALERFDADNFPSADKLRKAAVEFFEHAPPRFGQFDASRPEPDQRNVVIDASGLAPDEELQASRIFSELLRPLRLNHHRQIRMLVCEGPSLLAWFGAFHPEPATERQRDLLRALLPALRRRLSLERRLDAGPVRDAGLEAVLGRIGSPAFIVNSGGRIFELNEPARALLDDRRFEVAVALRAALTGKPTALAFELTPLRLAGVDALYLAILGPRTTDARITQAVAIASNRMRLTTRQRVVLERVVRGESTTAIATALTISEGAVEQHLTAILERAAVDSRAALVALVLAGR